MISVTFRPLTLWPHESTHPRRGRYTFQAGWQSTLVLLSREVEMLDGENVVLGGFWTESDIRRDGLPRAGMRRPSHPGVEISFDSPGRGRLVYATDSCELWEHNVRSIALGLEALRAVDRYGITRRGEQYAGFRELTSGAAARGRELIAKYGSLAAALKATHPDHGGNRDDFEAVLVAREEGL